MPDPDFTLLPADDEGLSPEEDLDAAVAGALDVPEDEDVLEEAPQPFGRTVLFDFEDGRMIRRGGSPVWVSGLRSLEMWCLMALHTARLAHPIFSEDFGIEHPEGPIGLLGSEEVISDYGDEVREALLVHDRVVAVENFEGEWLPDDGIILINFEVVTDEEDLLRFSDLRIGTVLE